MKSIRSNSKELLKLYNRGFDIKKSVREKVSNILEDVRSHGDDALVKYTRRFDNVKMKVRQLKVSAGEINEAYQDMDPSLVSSFKIAIENITQFYRKQLKKSWKIKQQDGIMLGEKITPLESVGIYI
ncbi:MAG: histidinol dehydrogenase, partial [Dehalococcoidia bacterium]